jgi:hypothetical protein
MAWTTPRTWVSGELVKADDLNAQVRDNQTLLKVPIDTATGKITALTSTYFASLSTASLTGIAKLTATNTFTGVNNFNGGASSRVILPVGPNRYT